MRRLFVVVEGNTEEFFVKTLVGPHLWDFDVHPEVINVHGGLSWQPWRKTISRLMKSQPRDARFTTLFDLYGLPKDFPGLDEGRAERDTSRRAEALEGEMKAALEDDDRLIPYLQRHEMEALIYVDLTELRQILDAKDDLDGLDQLRESTIHLAPEDINDDVTTAPSKRLLSHIPSYRKNVHGPLVLEALGLDRIRRSCPRFDMWLSRLEALKP